MTSKRVGGLCSSSPVSFLGGVGKARRAAYKKLGINTVEDLLLHIPRAYENRGDVLTLATARSDGSKSSLVLAIGTVPKVARIRGKMEIVKLNAYDETGVVELTFFNAPYLRTVFTPGSVWRFFGVLETRLSRNGARYYMTSPAYEPYSEEGMQDFVPVYPLTEGITQKQIFANIRESLSHCESLEDIIPPDIRSARGLCTYAYALRNIHNPDSYLSINTAKRRLIYEEFFLFSLASARRGQRVREGVATPCTKQNITPLLKLLPYELTGAQKRAISDIATDMRSSVPMRRILIGDVGCGKTVVAASAILISVLSGGQAALMAPTEILARQHYDDLAPLFQSMGISCELLIGATTQKEKNRIYSMLTDRTPDSMLRVVIGTHALISEKVAFSDLRLVVTDEQHRFGVNQRTALAQKSEGAHVLAMSATPIPRSLALVMYGELDISLIDEMPPGRKAVDTFVVDEGYRERLLAFIEKTALDGGQVYIVCPSVEESEHGDGSEISLEEIGEEGVIKKPPLKAAVEYAHKLQERLQNLTVGFIHGRLKSAEKEEIMNRFESGDIDVLVSTTVIEVGVNVPNASLMIIENAERFGLSQLHQLRGRVGRGGRKSYCVLVSDDSSEKAQTRLSVMKNNHNGFAIAEADLKARGPGDFLASQSSDVRQSGGLRFKFSDLGSDGAAFTAATEDARKLLEDDPTLSKYPLLVERLDSLCSQNSVD